MYWRRNQATETLGQFGGKIADTTVFELSLVAADRPKAPVSAGFWAVMIGRLKTGGCVVGPAGFEPATTPL